MSERGRLILFCWVALLLKVAPHGVLRLYGRGLDFDELLRHHDLILREANRCVCLMMPFHQWTLVLVLLMAYRVRRHCRRGVTRRQLPPIAGMVAPLVIACGLAVHEYRLFWWAIADMDPFRRLPPSSAVFRPLGADSGSGPRPNRVPDR